MQTLGMLLKDKEVVGNCVRCTSDGGVGGRSDDE